MISRMKGKHSHLPPVVENRDVEDFLSPETCVVVTVLSGNKQLNILIITVEDKSMHVTTTTSSTAAARCGHGTWRREDRSCLAAPLASGSSRWIARIAVGAVNMPATWK